MTRILITGSRDWTNKDVLISTLRKWWLDNGQPSDAVLVSGGCPTGADAYAEELWTRLGFPLEVHKADWATFGNAAGPIRNRAMVNLGADVCFAFIKNHSRGATGCAQQARLKGIPVILIQHTDGD